MSYASPVLASTTSINTGTATCFVAVASNIVYLLNASVFSNYTVATVLGPTTSSGVSLQYTIAIATAVFKSSLILPVTKKVV